jgi:hypothetical protein
MEKNPFGRTSTRLLLIGAIMSVTGLADFFYGPLIDARGFSVIGLVLIVVGLLLKRKD